MSEFAFNGNAGIYSNANSARPQGSGVSSAAQTASPTAAAVAVVESFSHIEEDLSPNSLDERQIELLLWLSNLELRLPPYGDLN